MKEIFSFILCRQIGVKKNGQQYAMKNKAQLPNAVATTP